MAKFLFFKSNLNFTMHGFAHLPFAIVSFLNDNFDYDTKCLDLNIVGQIVPAYYGVNYFMTQR